MKKSIFIAVSLLLLYSTFSVNAQVPYNSKRFIVNNYFYPDSKGNFTRYRAHGFAQLSVNSVKGSIYYFPILSKNDSEIKYIDETGLNFTPNGTKTATAIIIPINIKTELPNPTQLCSIMGELMGEKQFRYYPPVAVGPMGSFLVIPQSQHLLQPLVDNANQYVSQMLKQQAIANEYKNYNAEQISLSELEVRVIIDNKEIGYQRFDGTFINPEGYLTQVEITNPTIYQQNRISQGNYRLVISYKFRDSKVSSINAQFDAKTIIDQFMKESQTSAQQSSSSGWSFLGFGSRRKSLKTSFDRSVENQYNGDHYQSTVVEMYDATDDMIAEFERDFFPELTQQRVIENHLKAANEAAAQGNTALRDLHLKYASSLQNNDPNLEVDIAKAVASLSQNDYVGFIANGVRWGDYRTEGNSSFRSVIHSHEEISKMTKWTQVRKVSVQHALTESIEALQEDFFMPSLGICGMIGYTYGAPVQTPWGMQLEQRQGIMPSCVIENGPAYKGGLMPGMIITKIGGKVINNLTELEELLDDYEPGDNLTIRILNPNAPQYSETDLTIKLTKGMIKESNQ